MVSIETVAPLQVRTMVEHTHSTVEFLLQETPGLFHLNYGCLTVLFSQPVTWVNPDFRANNKFDVFVSNGPVLNNVD